MASNPESTTRIRAAQLAGRMRRMAQLYNDSLYTEGADALEMLVLQEGELAMRLVEAERKIKELQAKSV